MKRREDPRERKGEKREESKKIKVLAVGTSKTPSAGMKNMEKVWVTVGTRYKDNVGETSRDLGKGRKSK